VDWREHIEQAPGVAGGKPVFKGTRLTVEFVLDRLAAGDSAEVLVAQYPVLRPIHLRAAVAYAASVVRQDELLLSA